MPPKRIAIIGSGIAGLAAAYWLGRQDVHVTVIERSANLGMDAHRVDLPNDGEVLSVDVPSRMFNARQWPTLMSLYDEIGVRYESVDASQSISSRISSDQTYLKLDTAFRPLQAMTQTLNTRSRALLGEASRLMEDGRRDLELGIAAHTTLSEYLDAGGYSASFKTGFLYPTLSSTVCTCAYNSLDAYPAGIILQTLKNLTDDRDLFRTRFGTRDVVARLTRDLTDIRRNCSVVRIEEKVDSVSVLTEDDQIECFDQAIVATQANTALKLLPMIPRAETEILEAIPYEDVCVSVHHDESLMPVKRSNWRTFNMLCHERAEGLVDRADCTVWLNRFDQDCCSRADVFQTISPGIAPAATHQIAGLRLQRPAVTSHSIAQLDKLAQLKSPNRRIWYCGSWAVPGVPLLETAVVSAKQAVDRILETSRTLC